MIPAHSVRRFLVGKNIFHKSTFYIKELLFKCSFDEVT